MSVSSGMLCTRSARCPVPSPVAVSLWSWSSVSMVSLWPSPLTWVSASAGFPAGSAGTSKPYARRASTPCSGLASSALSGCLCSVYALSTGPVPCALLWVQCRPQPALHPLVSAALSARLGVSGGGGVSVPSPPPSPEVSPPPPGQLFHSGGVNTLWQLDSPSYSLATPLGDFPPTRRTCSPHPCPPHMRTCWTGFNAGRKTSPLPLVSTHGGLLLPLV